MPKYQVRPGEVLPVNGVLLEAGDYVDLPREVADDMANRHLVQAVDAHGQPIALGPVDDLARFRTHERVSILRDQVTAAETVVTHLRARLAAEEQQLVADVQQITTRATAPAASADEPGQES